MAVHSHRRIGVFLVRADEAEKLTEGVRRCTVCGETCSRPITLGVIGYAERESFDDHDQIGVPALYCVKCLGEHVQELQRLVRAVKAGEMDRVVEEVERVRPRVAS